MTRLAAAIRESFSGDRLPYVNVAMALVLLAYYWPVGAIWFAVVVCGGVALVNVLRLLRM